MTLSVPAVITHETAVAMLRETAAGVKKWGRHAKPPFTLQQIVDAAMMVYDGCEARLNAAVEGRSIELAAVRGQLATANRRVAASAARAAKASKNNRIA